MSSSLENLAVTTIVRLKPKPGLKKETLNWFNKISDEAAHFNGHLGAEIFEAINDSPQPEFAIIIHFDTYENSMVWERSKERTKHLVLSKTLFDLVKPKIQLTGLEYWFETKKDKSAGSTPKWKMLIVTVAIIFLFANTLIPWLGHLFKPFRWPALVNSLLSIIMMVTLMTYWVMPFITKILSGWLLDEKNNASGNIK